MKTPRKITLNEKMFIRPDSPNRTYYYESESWVSNGVWAIRKDCVKNLEEFHDIASTVCFSHKIIEDQDVLKTVNYEKRTFTKTAFLEDLRKTYQKCMVRYFSDENGVHVAINDSLVKAFKIDEVTFGKEGKAYTTPDQALIIMPFTKPVKIARI